MRTVLLIITVLVGASNAFNPSSTVLARRATSSFPLKAAVVDTVETKQLSPTAPSPAEKMGSMSVDLDGIVFSGLKGQALSLSHEDFPMAKEIRAVIPADCFESNTLTSLSYLAVSTVGTALCTILGFNLLPFFDPSNLLTLPLWALYSSVTGTVAMGLWVLAHECGHGAFSSNKKLQDAVGYIIHSVMLVPYFSWQRSHAVHHRYTNHMELGETHVPEPLVTINEGSLALRQFFLKMLGNDTGLKAFGVIQLFNHLVIGWPAYLLIGATGGLDRGTTNHFYPYPLTKPNQPKKELFPGNWKEKVYQSDIGVAAVIGGLIAWAALRGPAEVMALYGGPLLVVNAWLVTYTWLQHTDVDVPHFSEDKHNFVKGALHTIDRPYDKLDPWGVIDFLHHKIGTTHVAHHFDSTIPHYKASLATDAVKQTFPHLYLYDPTPIPQALWRVSRGCTAVEKRGDYWIWKNDDVENELK